MRTLALTLNKRKTQEAAQKYIQKGAFDKALKEYMKLLKADPGDTNTRLKIGDLHIKRSEPDKAIESYANVAEQFSDSGFDAKAVAIYKQILRIDSEYIDAHVRLGELFQRLGLMSDALREFQAAIQLYEEGGLKREAFELLRRVATLDPGNVANRLSLANLLVRQDLHQEAREEYGSLLEEVKKRGDVDDLCRVCEQALSAFPDHISALETFIHAKVKMGLGAEAVRFATTKLSDLPEDVSVREALITAYESVNDNDGIARTYREIAELYKRRGDPDRAREILQRYVPIESFDDSETETPASLILEDEAPPSEPALEFATDETEPEQAEVDNPESELDELLAEARVVFEFGDRTDALHRVKVILESDPNHAATLAFKAEVDSIIENVDAAPQLEDSSAKLDTDLADVEDDAIDLPDVELVLEGDHDRNAKFASIDPPVHEELRAAVSPTPTIGDSTDDDDFEVELDLDVDDLNEILKDAPSLAAEPSEVSLPVGGSELAEETSDVNSQSWSADSTRINESLDAAEAILEQGELDDAERAYQKVLEVAPHHPQALLRLGEIAKARECAPEDVQTEHTAIPAPAEIEIPEEPLLADASAIGMDADDSEFTEAEPLQDVPLLDDSDLEDFEIGPPLEVTDEIPDADPSTPDEGDFDLAAELELEDDDSLAQHDGGFEAVFHAFKRGIQEQIGEDEVQAHYDLAIAYKEMGLYSDAVDQLDLVARADVLQIEALSLMAVCKVELGAPLEAARHLEEALAVCGDSDDSTVALRYDLAEVLVAAGKGAEAFEAFKKVAAVDPGYRDVSQKILELGSNLGETGE